MCFQLIFPFLHHTIHYFLWTAETNLTAKWSFQSILNLTKDVFQSSFCKQACKVSFPTFTTNHEQHISDFSNVVQNNISYSYIIAKLRTSRSIFWNKGIFRLHLNFPALEIKISSFMKTNDKVLSIRSLLWRLMWSWKFWNLTKIKEAISQPHYSQIKIMVLDPSTRLYEPF